MKKQPNRSLANRLDVASWGVFFVWAGVCLLTQIELGVALFGVAAIILGFQAARAVARLRVEWFWVVVGLCFAAGGMWQTAQLEVPYFPIVMIIVGAAIALTAIFGHRRHHTS